MTAAVLVFEIDGYRLALDASLVLSINGLPELTPVPCLPDYIAGICSLRGEIVPVVDLTALWGIQHKREYKCLITFKYAETCVAVMADKVVAARNRGETSTNNAPAAGFGRYVAALLTDQTALLDADLLLKAILNEKA